jgi:hypothetical protein
MQIQIIIFTQVKCSELPRIYLIEELPLIEAAQPPPHLGSGHTRLPRSSGRACGLLQSRYPATIGGSHPILDPEFSGW